MVRICVFILGILSANIAFSACLSDDQLQQITKKETSYLSQKIPPAFKHALEDNLANVTVISAEGDGCLAKLVLTLPQDEIDEANAVLDAQPAKKIMLGAQGYQLPQNKENAAIFTVDANSLEITPADILQTASFGKLRASVELMYSFITQKRAEVSATQTNTNSWPKVLREQVVNRCSSKKTAAVCSCTADQYALKIPARQMEYILANEENPYAMATGANQGFEVLKQSVDSVCNG